MTMRGVGRDEWLGLFLAPVAFFAHLQLAYLLVPLSCVTGSHLRLNLADAAAVIAATVGAVVARRSWVRGERRVAQGEEGPPSAGRFLGVVGSFTSATFVLLLLAQWSASLLISPCQ